MRLKNKDGINRTNDLIEFSKKPLSGKGGAMDGRIALNHWLQDLTGSKDAALRADGTYGLLLRKKLTIMLFVPDDGSRLIIMADLLRLNALTPDILLDVAAINLRFDLTGGLTVALEKSSSTILAFYQYALGSLDFDSFRRLLTTVEAKLLKLQETVEALALDSRPPGNAHLADISYGEQA